VTAPTLGAVLSMCSTTDRRVRSLGELESFTSHQVSSAGVSAEKVVGRQSPAEYAALIWSQSHFSVTLPRYQPVQSAGTGEHAYVSTGVSAYAETADQPAISSPAHTARAARAARGRLRIGESVGGPSWRGRRYSDRRPHIGRCQFSRGQPELPALLRADDEDDQRDDSRDEEDEQIDDDRHAEKCRHTSPVAGVFLGCLARGGRGRSKGALQ
jgi:hypothetical protein